MGSSSLFQTNMSSIFTREHDFKKTNFGSKLITSRTASLHEVYRDHDYLTKQTT